MRETYTIQAWTAAGVPVLTIRTEDLDMAEREYVAILCDGFSRVELRASGRRLYVSDKTGRR